MLCCRVHKRFREVSPDLVPKSMTGNEPVTVQVPRDKMVKLPELRVSKIVSSNTLIYIWYRDFFNMIYGINIIP